MGGSLLFWSFFVLSNVLHAFVLDEETDANDSILYVWGFVLNWFYWSSGDAHFVAPFVAKFTICSIAVEKFALIWVD